MVDGVHFVLLGRHEFCEQGEGCCDLDESPIKMRVTWSPP